MPDTDSVSYCVVGQEGLLHDRRTGRLLLLNPSARRVWELANAGEDEAAIARTLCAAYAGVEPAQAERDVRVCLTELGKLGMTIPPIQGELDDLGQQ